MNQLWHVPLSHKERVAIKSTDTSKTKLKSETTNGWYSSLYGQKEHTSEICFCTESDVINTVIELI
jgi:hypothetical protein